MGRRFERFVCYNHVALILKVGGHWEGGGVGKEGEELKILLIIMI